MVPSALIHLVGADIEVFLKKFLAYVCIYRDNVKVIHSSINQKTGNRMKVVGMTKESLGYGWRTEGWELTQLNPNTYWSPKRTVSGQSILAKTSIKSFCSLDSTSVLASTKFTMMPTRGANIMPRFIFSRGWPCRFTDLENKDIQNQHQTIIIIQISQNKLL